MAMPMWRILWPRWRRLEKEATKHPKKHSAHHRIHVCVEEVTQLYKENPSIPEQSLLKVVKLYVHKRMESKEAKRCIAGVHKHFHEQNKENSRVLPVQSSKVRTQTRAQSPRDKCVMVADQKIHQWPSS